MQIEPISDIGIVFVIIKLLGNGENQIFIKIIRVVAPTLKRPICRQGIGDDASSHW